MRLYSYVLHKNSVLFDAFCVALCTLCCCDVELVKSVCERISYLRSCAVYRRSVADVARCYNDALSELVRRSAAVGCAVFMWSSDYVSLRDALCGAFCAVSLVERFNFG